MSEFYNVLKRWVIVKVVIFLLILSTVSYINFSFVLSSALVASSNNNIFGFIINALAIAILYF